MIKFLMRGGFYFFFIKDFRPNFTGCTSLSNASFFFCSILPCSIEGFYFDAWQMCMLKSPQKEKKKKKWSETNQPFTNKWGKIGARPPILNFASVK